MSSSILASKAVGLVRDARRNVNELTPYNDETIQAVIDEIRALSRELICIRDEHTIEEQATPYIAANILVHYSSILRNKRCVLAFLAHRIQLIQDLRWDLGTTVLPKAIVDNLHRLEMEFFNKYQNLLAVYMRSINGLDLTLSDMPPKKLMIQVRVLRNFGNFATLDGTVNLEKGTTHFLKRSDVESLVRQGIVEHIAF